MNNNINENSLAPVGINVDEWNQGYNDAIREALKARQLGGENPGGGGGGGVEITNLRRIVNKNSNDNDSNQQSSPITKSSQLGGDEEKNNKLGNNNQNNSGQNAQGDDETNLKEKSSNQNSQNGNNSNGGDPLSGDDSNDSSSNGSSSSGSDGDDSNSGSSGGSSSGSSGGDSFDDLNGSSGNDGNNNADGLGTSMGNDNSDSNGEKSSSQNNSGSENGNQNKGSKVYRVSTGKKWGIEGDLITVEEGLKILQKEGYPIDNKNPIEHAKKIFKEICEHKDGHHGHGSGSHLEGRMLEINELLKPPAIQWKLLLARHFNEFAIRPNNDVKIKKPRFGTHRPDRFEKVKEFKSEDRKRDSADIFYLVDNSGSVGDEELLIVFRELIGLELNPKLDIRKSAMTYFSDDFSEDRIRLWYRDTPKKERMRLLKRVPGEDVSGGTNIGLSVVHVTQLRKSPNLKMRNLYSIYKPQTLIIVFTDGEDSSKSYGMISKLPLQIRYKIIFIILNNKSRFNEIVNYAVNIANIPERNVVCIDTDDLKLNG